jgi:hypothetical protein
MITVEMTPSRWGDGSEMSAVEDDAAPCSSSTTLTRAIAIWSEAPAEAPALLPNGWTKPQPPILTFQ